MSNEQAPDSCPFCGASRKRAMGLIGLECGTMFSQGENSRRYQTDLCILAERERLTRERDEARAAHTNALNQIGDLCMENANLLARVKRLEEESESRWLLAQSAIASCAEMSSRIKRLEEAGEWQPIETAPTDKTWVIGFDSKDGEVGTIIFDLTGDAEDDDTHYEWTDGMRTWHPTHWMPIPDPPKAKEAKP